MAEKEGDNEKVNSISVEGQKILTCERYSYRGCPTVNVWSHCT